MNAQPGTAFKSLPAGADVLLVGPMLERAPSWPDCAILFVDGGARWQAHLPTDFPHPTLSVGDGDSHTSGDLDIALPVEKDYSDLGYALQLLPERTAVSLTLTGFLGGRRDHEWINFGEVARFLEGRDRTLARFDDAVIALSAGQHALDHHGPFSLVNFSGGHTRITGDVDFPLTRSTWLAPHSSHGLSNGARGAFQVWCEVPTLCFLVEEG